MSKILPAKYIAKFAMDDEREKQIMKKTTNKLKNNIIISYVNLGKWRDPYGRICEVGKGGNSWCIVQHGWVGGFGKG